MPDQKQDTVFGAETETFTKRLKMNPKIFPTILIMLDLCASIVWFMNGDIRKAIYWTAAAILTMAVTF